MRIARRPQKVRASIGTGSHRSRSEENHSAGRVSRVRRPVEEHRPGDPPPLAALHGVAHYRTTGRAGVRGQRVLDPGHLQVLGRGRVVLAGDQRQGADEHHRDDGQAPHPPIMAHRGADDEYVPDMTRRHDPDRIDPSNQSGPVHSRPRRPRGCRSPLIGCAVTLHLHTAERTDALADGLADLLVTPLARPVRPRGRRRARARAWSGGSPSGSRTGSASAPAAATASAPASTSSTPHSLVADAARPGRRRPWDPTGWRGRCSRSSTALGEPGFDDLARHLGTAATRARRAAARPAATPWPGGWPACSRRTPCSARSCSPTGAPAGTPTAPAATSTPTCAGRPSCGGGWSPGRRAAARRAARRRPSRGCAAGGDGLDLPARLSLFGHTRLPVTEVALLRALGELREVHLWLPQASPPVGGAGADRRATARCARGDDESAALVGHPLLASLGRDSRELHRALGAARRRREHARGSADRADTLLGWLQDDLRANAAPDAGDPRRAAPRPGDGSVQVHACHGAARQVDVLREVLVGLLAGRPDARAARHPRDVPRHRGLRAADLGGLRARRRRRRRRAPAPPAAGPARRPVAGRHQPAARRSPPSCRAGRRPGRPPARCSTSPAAPPVRPRFGFDDDELERRPWVDAGRHPLGPRRRAPRAPFGLDGFDAQHLAPGLDRVLLGAAMAGAATAGRRHAARSTTSAAADVDLAGRFAELVDRLHAFVRAAERAPSAPTGPRLSDGVAGLTAHAAADVVAGWPSSTASSRGSPTRRRGERRHPAAAGRRARPAGAAAARRPTRANFRTGTLTVCTMVPMRSVPHRVVCLVGLDDGVFPRARCVDGDDVLARDPLTGERDLRSEDRQLLLDAIARRDREASSSPTPARGEHTGAERPPAVPLGELLDALDRTAASRCRDTWSRTHPLQPFDEANFVAGGCAPAPFTFDRAALAGARAARAARGARPRCSCPTPAAGRRAAGDVALADLQDFFRTRCAGSSASGSTSPRPTTPTRWTTPSRSTLDALEKWAVGDRIVRDVLAGADPEAAMHRRAAPRRAAAAPARGAC